jgi:serine phosphatase RsbU (regulator of sigma subunit)
MVAAPCTATTNAFARQALQDLARLAREGVVGCVGASVSLLQQGTANTLSATPELIRGLDEAQYRQGEGPCLTAMRDQKPVSVKDYRTDTRWPNLAADTLAFGMRSSLSLPLTQAGRTIGGLNMYGSAVGAFTVQSRRAAENLAGQAGLMFGYLQQLHGERAAHQREHQVATTLQRSLLPTLPTIEGITCAARYLASADHAQVGGDWYDVFALPDRAIGLAVGDVMGHDLAAAAAMGQLRSVLRSYAYEGSSPSVVLDRMDRLVQGFDMAEVATAMYGRLTLQNGTGLLQFANAGHLPPLVRHPEGTICRLEGGRSVLIGAPAPHPIGRAEAAEMLPAGSLLLLYTDGLVETRHHDIDAGIDRLSAALAGLGEGVSPQHVCDALTAELIGPDQDDDVALLAVHIDAPT